MRATEKYFHIVLFIMLYKVGLFSLSLWPDRTQVCEHSYESHSKVVPCGVLISQPISLSCQVCGGQVLTLFRPDELELLICGCPVIDFYELEVAASYEEGYNHTHPTIIMLWKVVNEMTVEQKKAFLMFVTGSDRVPLKGLVNLTFIVQRHGGDSDRLPTALTCFNRLLLPEYSTREKLKERLIVAIENCKGFGLT